MAKLGEVCKVSPSTKNIERQGAWLLNLDMVEQQTGRVVEYNFVGEDGLNGSITQFDTENVLYSKLRPNLNKVVLPERNGFCTSELLPLRPDARKLDRSYLAVFLRSDGFINWAVSKTAGAKMPRLGTKDLLNANIPLPEIKEQKAIAEKFEKLEELICLRKQQIAKLDELVKARFVEMFGEPVSNPMGWEKKKLQDVCYKLTDGTHFSPESYDEGDYKYITAKNIKSDGFDFSNITYVPESVHRTIYERCNPELGDVLYIKDGATTGIAMVNSLEEEFSLLSSVALLKQNRKVIDGRFLCGVLNNAEMYKSIRSNMGGAAITRLTIAKLQKIMVIVPPLPLQKQFATFVKRVDQQKQTVQQSLEKLELMKKALMQEYFG